MLFNFYFKKSFREQKKSIFALPIITVLVIVFTVLGILYFPSSLTMFTSHMIESSYKLVGKDKDGALLVASLIGSGPFFAAAFCGMIGSNISSNMLDLEIRSGALETTLSCNYSFAQVLRTLFTVGLLLGVITSAVLILFISLVMFYSINYYSLPLDILFPKSIFIVPFVCLLSGFSGGFVLQILMPRMAKIKAGSAANIGQSASIVPTILLVILFVLPIDMSMWTKVTYFSVFLIVTSILSLVVAIKCVSIAKILER